MGYWGYRATESDSALDYMSKIVKYLEKLWDEAEDYGERMAVVYVLTEAPEVDMMDFNDLKSRAATYVSNYAAMIEDRNIDEMRQGEIEYLQGLVTKLQSKQGTSLGEKLELTNHEKRAIERFPMVIKINPMVIKIN
jgi:hypothetical protein